MKPLTTHFVTKRWCDSNLAPFCVLVMEIWCEAFMESICPALPSHEHPAQNLLSSQNSCQIFSSSLISCQICCNNKIIQHWKTNIISSSLVTYNHYCFEPQCNGTRSLAWTQPSFTSTLPFSSYLIPPNRFLRSKFWSRHKVLSSTPLHQPITTLSTRWAPRPDSSPPASVTVIFATTTIVKTNWKRH